MTEPRARRVVAVTRDLMDGSRIRASVPGVTIVRTGAELPARELGPDDVVLVDLAVAGAVAVALATGAGVIAYGSHVDGEVLEAAGTLGADAMARSRFFRLLAGGDLLDERP